MGPRVQREENRNQATPLSQDIIKMLQGQIAQGAFGHGVGPQQRSAGTSMDQFISSLQNRISGGGINTENQFADESGKLIGALENKSKVATARSAADLKEGFGAQGSRFGTASAIGEAQLRADAGMNLDQVIGQIMQENAARKQSARQFDVQANMGLDQMLMGGIESLFNMSQANINPFLQMAQMGIMPEELIVSPGIGDQIITGLIEGGGKVAGARAGRG